MSDGESTYYSDDERSPWAEPPRIRTPSPEPPPRERSPSPEPPSVVKVPPYLETLEPTTITPSKHLRVMKETLNVHDIDTRLVSFYKPEIQNGQHTDIYCDGYVVHLNIDRLQELCDKPARKLRTNQKRLFYYYTPTGQNVLHLIANYIHKSYIDVPELCAIAMRLIKWEHLDPTVIDANGMNFFNYLIGDDGYITHEIIDIYKYLLSQQIYPNFNKITKKAVLEQNFAPLWQIYYKTLNIKQTTLLLENLKYSSEHEIETILDRTHFRDSRWSDLNQFMISVFNHAQPYTPRFYKKLFDYLRELGHCRGCAVKNLTSFLKLVTKKLSGKDVIPYLYTCGSNGLYTMLFGRLQLFKIAVYAGNFNFVEHVLNKFIDAGGFDYDQSVEFMEVIKATDDYDMSCTKILINKHKLDIIKQIISLTTDGFIIEQLEKYLKGVRHNHKHTEGTYTCATCWEEFDATTKPGNTFTRCGHFPFCDTCYEKMTFCPFCYEQSESGRSHDMLSEIAFFKSTTFDPASVKMWNVEHSLA